MTEPAVELDPVLNDATKSTLHQDLPDEPMPTVDDAVNVLALDTEPTLETYTKVNDWTGWTVIAHVDTASLSDDNLYELIDPQTRGQGVYSTPAEIDAVIGAWVPLELHGVDPVTGFPPPITEWDEASGALGMPSTLDPENLDYAEIVYPDAAVENVNGTGM